MPLQPHTRLGPYDVLSLIGAGGMGEVYRARDTRLGRDVALKVLTPALALDNQFRQRFEREARSIAALSHPHICGLYDIGRHDGIDYLVIEYLDGQTLAERLQKGALPIHQALQYGVQIADALARAHRAGITHRDLKPGNVMLTRDGVKLLDFGLATTARGQGDDDPAAVTHAMTQAATAHGVVLGTPHYMAPEALEGREIDTRSDIFALGVVLYEMLSGQRPFSGRSLAQLAAAVLEHTPTPLGDSVAGLPPAVTRAVHKALAKDPDARWQSAADLRDELQWSLETLSTPAATATKVSAAMTARRWTRVLPWAAIVAAAMVTGVLAWAAWDEVRPADPPRYISTLVATDFSDDPSQRFAIAPDGSQVAYAAPGTHGTTMLWLRSLRERTAELLPGTEGALSPFWSPDSQSLGFFSGTSMRRLDLASRTIREICTGCGSAEAQPGAWSDTDVIVFRGVFNGGLSKVSAEGASAPSPLIGVDSSKGEINLSSPAFLPDGRRFLFIAAGTDFSTLYVGDLDGTRSRPLMQGLASVAFAHGHLVFVRGSNLLAQPFDLTRLEPGGKAIPIRSDVLHNNVPVGGGAAVSISRGAELVSQFGYIEGKSQVVIKNRIGSTIRTVAPIADYADLFLSHDARYISVSTVDHLTGGRDVTIIEVATGKERRLTSLPGNEMEAVWSWRSGEVFFNVQRGATMDIFRKRADGSGIETLIRASPIRKYPQGVSPDDRYLFFMTVTNEQQDLWRMDLQTGDVTPWQVSASNEGGGQYSRDGRWVTYWSDGHVWIRPADGGGGPWQVSNDQGGAFPRWSSDMSEIFYRSGDRLMATRVRCATICEVEAATRLFDVKVGGSGRWSYDVLPGGQQFVVLEAAPSMEGPLELFVNWHTLLGPASSR